MHGETVKFTRSSGVLVLSRETEAVCISETLLNTRHITKWLVASFARVAEWDYRVSHPTWKQYLWFK